MSDVVISVEGLGKKYRIRHQGAPRYVALRDVVVDKVATPIRWVRGKRRSANGSQSSGFLSQMPNAASREDFWALKDVCFEVKQGEVVGIVGRNGAGKSTLLKILSRITEPTAGRVQLEGRVSSLLEVGTGFHPELTGRENVFLNGAILGMTRTEIKKKFDEIVAFAELERFLDTPVKWYSSGMYVRLAFAIAAHMEPEILIVDEVLAVGDAAFQDKCIGKMNAVAKSDGRTVLFVSHNVSVVQHLCSRAVLLRSGRIAASGETSAIISEYLSEARRENRIALADWTDRITSGEARITRLEVGDDAIGNHVAFGQDFRFRIHATFKEPLADPTFGLIIHDASGVPLANVQTIHQGLRLGRVDGNIAIDGVIPNINLYPGRYFLSPWIMDSAAQRDVDFPRMCAELNITPTAGPHGDLKLDSTWGKYFLPSVWKSAQCQ